MFIHMSVFVTHKSFTLCLKMGMMETFHTQYVQGLAILIGRAAIAFSRGQRSSEINRGQTLNSFALNIFKLGIMDTVFLYAILS